MKHESAATHKFSYSERQKEVANTGNWEWVKPANGEANKVQIITFGKLTLTASNGLVIVCKAIDAGNIWNEAATGKDNIEAFVNYECVSEPVASCAPGGVTVTSTASTATPWATELTEVGGKPFDKIKGINITVTCNGTPVVFEGELTPEIVNGTETEPTFAKFVAGSGTLTSPSGLTGTVSGSDRLLGFEHGEDIRVK